MNRLAIPPLTVAFMAVAAAGVITAGQSGSAAVAAHRAAAKAAAGDQFSGLLERVCAEPQPAASTAQRGQAAPAQAARREAPPREQWHAEPVKVFDNFYFVGTREHGAWAVATTEGLIVIDALYDYAVIDEVENGLKKLGLDATTMKYLIISHGHGDHHGGTKYLQDKYRPRVVMGPADWDLVERDTRNPRPTRDIAATDGQKITLGDTTITLYITPGHTASTISLLVPVKDGARTHIAASWGGTAFNPGITSEAIKAYVQSARRFRDLAAKAGADVIFTNHTAFDDTNKKLVAVAARKPGAPHPYVIGPDAVKRYLTVAEECGLAAIAAGR
jgi:metallo-beta-lactamase class B